MITHVNDGINNNIHIAHFVRVYFSWVFFTVVQMRSGKKCNLGSRRDVIKNVKFLQQLYTLQSLMIYIFTTDMKGVNLFSGDLYKL